MYKALLKLNIFLIAILLFACAIFVLQPRSAYSATGEAEIVSGGTVEADIRDIADPMALSIEKKSRAFLAALAFAALLMSWALYCKFSEKKPDEVKAEAPPEPKIPPHVTALEELEALSRSDLLFRREFKLWYMRISWICRAYIGSSLDFNCVDLDAYEIMAKLRSKNVSNHLVSRFDEILSECDLVKFAKAAPDESDAREELQKCVDAVKKSRDVNFR
ncbi:MAG TPA: hypothetical protein PKK26_02835 [Candidatus Wallbacteria bacterium]|nr:hypothetical protein [Candidatus Wallbacteria bacterium]